MDTSLWIAVLAIAAGTYAMRLLPLLWMRAHLQKHNDKEALEVVPQWITILGPLMIAAMLGVSLIPQTPETNAWLTTAGGAIATLLVWFKTRSLGIPVLVGVVVYGLLRFVL